MVVVDSVVPLGGILFAIKTMSHVQGVRGVVEAAVGVGGMAGVAGGGGGESSPLLTVTIDRMETITLPVVDTTATAAAIAAGAVFDAIGGTGGGSSSGDGNNIIASHPFTHTLTTRISQWQEFVALLLHHWTVLKQQIKTSTHSGGVYESVAQPLRQGGQMARNALECLTVEPVLTALLVVVRYIRHS